MNHIERDLEYRYRKLERGVRIMMKNKSRFSPYLIKSKIKKLASTYQKLGRKPISSRWPL